jgi:hypothetical protein
MANGLSSSPGGPPPAPFPNGVDQQGGSSVALPQPAMPGVSTNALARNAIGSQAQPGGNPAQMPAPSHDQTVAALRHFQTVANELRELLMNPDIGKSDMKSSIIDGITKLVADRIMSPAQAVSTLATVPDRPFDQKQWVETHFQEQIQAQAAVLDHHRQSNMGTGDYNLESQLYPNSGNADDHMKTMNGMMQQHYRPQQ